MKRNFTIIMMTAFILLMGSCSSDPEGPVTSIFLEDGSYRPEAGETFKYVNLLSDVRVVEVDGGIGKSSMLKLGEKDGLRFESILMSFDIDSLENYSGLTVDSVSLDLPVIAVSEGFHLGITFHELTGSFSEDDTISVAPAYIADPIEGPLGETVRDINFERISFSLDPDIVQGWIDGTGTPWAEGIIIRWEGELDSLGLIEMKSQNYTSDPPAVRVRFSDESVAVFAVTGDYNIASYDGDGLSCVGGTATRIFFESDLSDIEGDAMVHYSALVLHIDGANGFGATYGEGELGFTDDFIFYLYTPDLADINDPGFLEGTGVSTNTFIPTVSGELRISLAGFTRDVLEGLRINTGLVFQSDMELVRYQKASFFDMSAADSLRPYIEIIYSRPADFDGE
ncbi:MAG: hypothetical protein KAV42_07850 [Candidatus Krumholzibacteria bacterium]|nr:hypothetical protein [Candidatus Krumholzibacteria bacterium]